MVSAENSAALLKKLTTPAADGLEVGPAESPAAAFSDRPGQFGPLPAVIRPFSKAERNTKRDRRGGGGGRAIILLAVGISLAAVLVWAIAGAVAQQSLAPKPAAAPPAKNSQGVPRQQQPSQQQPSQQQQAQPQQPAMPVSTEQALYLIRSTLLTLNDANRSGNYTVLRDLAAPDFQVRNTAADLSQIFSDLRRRNFDLYGAALLAPQLTAVPALDQRGFLHLAGYFPTRPQQINFDLLFANVGNQWRLFGIAVITPDAQPEARR